MEFAEALNILCNSGGLHNLQELTNERFVLIAIESLVQSLAETLPSSYGWGVIYGFVPTSGSALEVHGGYADPN